MAGTSGRLRIERRDSDITLPKILYGKLPPFSKMNPRGLERNPMSVVLRRYKKGEVICRQGAPGWTAFYLLTAQELLEYRTVPRQQHQQATGDREKLDQEIDATRNSSVDPGAGEKLARLEERREKLTRIIDAWEQYIPYIEGAIPLEHTARDDGTGDSAGGVMIVRLTVASPVNREPDGHGPPGRLVQLITGRRPGTTTTTMAPPRSIPIDVPRNLGYETREDLLGEGELFGEMSCMYRSPRAATVIAARDCYVLEMLRSILDKMLEIEEFKKRTDEIYRERVLKLHLDALPLLSWLDEPQKEQVRRRAEPIDVQAGDLIFDEHERPDGLYLIRSGIIKVIEGASALLDARSIRSWPALCDELRSGAGATPEGPRGEVWKRLSAPARDALALAATPEGRPPERAADVIDALNDLVMDPLLRESEGFRDLARERRFTRMAWRSLADPGAATDRDRIQCQRLLLESLYKTAMTRLKPRASEADADPDADPGEGESALLFHESELDDWQPVAAALAAGIDPAAAAAKAKREPTPQDIARGKVWNLLPEPVRELARRAAQAAGPKPGPVTKKGLPPKPAVVEKKAAGLAPDQARDLVAAFNALVQGHPLLLDEVFSEAVRARNKEGEELAEKLREFLPGRRSWSRYDFKHQCRAFNRALLEAAFPGGLRPRGPSVGPARILAYRARGEFIGEMALLDSRPRMATCVALSHAPDDPKREVGPVQLVKIGKDLFEELKRSEAFHQHVAAVAAERRAATAEPRPPGDRVQREVGALIPTSQGEDLGLIQGRRLMVIDLDRCTRCDECVQACVATHDDGRTRLFLDGPRIGKYLVPATCRSCLDPVCMIGCPVGSIHRGDNGQILIRDWCIGCEQCAEQCPYAAIQMHDIGIVPEKAHTWQFRSAGPAPRPAPECFQEGRDWQLGSTPFVNDREFRSLLGVGAEGSAGDRSVLFRHEFQVGRSRVGPDHRFVLNVTSADKGVMVWLNGTPMINASGDRPAEEVVPVSERERRGVGVEFEAELSSRHLRAGPNVLAVRIGSLPPEGALLLKLRLDEVRQAETMMGFEEDTAEKPITLRAVVCDLCSDQLGQRPACVTACPHDAAIRIDARALLAPG
jgi:Fe-S-cluster-containing hydrogenase component 2/CRP-like cAMP-binding protein